VLGKTGIRGRAISKKKEPEEGEEVWPLNSSICSLCDEAVTDVI
jgi:hypothetical protein